MNASKFIAILATVVSAGFITGCNSEHNKAQNIPDITVSVNPTKNVPMGNVAYSGEDCRLYTRQVSNFQNIRNYGGSLEVIFQDETLENLRVSFPAIYGEWLEIAENIWNKPENALTKEQAGEYGRAFCEAHTRR